MPPKPFMSTASLTPKQLQILRFILDYREKKGLSPTFEEIGEELKVNRVTVFCHVREMEKKGVLRKSHRLSRSIEPLLSPEDQAAWIPPIPVLGRVAAGLPIEAIEDREHFDFRDFVPPNGETFMLRVKGESMIEDGIRNGDFVLIENRKEANNGETVVAIVGEGEATLKRFYREQDRIRLQPANANMQPIYIQAGEPIEIRGVVIGLIRKI